VAHGFEIVQSPFPGWRFQPADTVAAGGLHGACLIGPRIAIDDDPAVRARWVAALARFTIALERGGEAGDRGAPPHRAGGPLSALRHLVGLLATDRDNPPLAAGEIVTTGTLTRAFDVKPGETWRTTLDGIDLDGIAVRFT